MLSSVLKSKRAIQVNILIVKTFVKLRQILSSNNELAQKLIELEKRLDTHDHHISRIFEAIHSIMNPRVVKVEPKPEPPKKKIGFGNKRAISKRNLR